MHFVAHGVFYGGDAVEGVVQRLRVYVQVRLPEGIPFQPAKTVFHGDFRFFSKFFGRFCAGEPAVCVAFYAVSHLAAQQLVDGNPEVLALDVPERHLHTRERAHEDYAPAPVGVAAGVVPEGLDVVGVFADEVPLELHDRLHDGRLAVFEGGFADPVEPGVVMTLTKTQFVLYAWHTNVLIAVTFIFAKF